MLSLISATLKSLSGKIPVLFTVQNNPSGFYVWWKSDETHKVVIENGALRFQGGEVKYPLRYFNLPYMVGVFLFLHRKRLSFHVLPSKSR